MSMLAAVLVIAALPQAVLGSDVEIRDYGQVADLWTPSNSRQNSMTHPNLEAGKEGCVAIGFQIEPDGHTSNVQVLRVVAPQSNEDQRENFTRTTTYWAQNLQFAATGAARPVYTYDITLFTMARSSPPEAAELKAADELKQRCVIKDFPARIHSLLKS